MKILSWAEGALPLILEKNDDSKREDFMKIPSRGSRKEGEGRRRFQLIPCGYASVVQNENGFFQERNSA